MPEQLVGQGRTADVFAAGPGRVLRRYRGNHGDATAEAEIMVHLRRHGFPVPEVHDAHGLEMLMERVEGPTMLMALQRRPWRAAEHGRTLGELHRRLHAIPTPSTMPPSRIDPEGHRLVHLDLHPGNVLLAPGGPVVIDWASAGRGEPATDVARSWAIIATSTLPVAPPLRVAARGVRRRLLASYLRSVDASAAARRLPRVARDRLEHDPHLMDEERRALEALASPARGPAPRRG